MITRLGIDLAGEEKTSSDTGLGPLSFREVIASLIDSEVGTATVPVNSLDYLLTGGDGAAPKDVDLILIQADQDFEVRVGTLGSYITVKRLDDNVAHAYFLASLDSADGIYVNTVPETRFKWWEGRKT